MRIARVNIENFRGIKKAEIDFNDHTVLVGDNNTGKSTILEAIDLVLGPERLQRANPIDEHDFYSGDYLGSEESPKLIKVEVIIVGLSDEQKSHFWGHIEWWNEETKNLIENPPPEDTDKPNIIPALRLGFKGSYDQEEDSFLGTTFFSSPENESGENDMFRTRDKRLCGFLFLRTLRTGSRALSLERGSLFDIILRLQEKRLTMWEDVLGELRQLSVAEKEELGISKILSDVQIAVRKFVPSDWAENPHIRVSNLTREHLRKALTVFMGTGAYNETGKEYAAPFGYQGTGTVNTLVLALLSMIAEQKQNVIFAMEEPEIAIPPHTQRRIVDSVRKMAAQAIFTSHSPYVLDEFNPDSLLILNRSEGILQAKQATLPPSVKQKAFRQELRTRFCESLLARRVLITEGRTEYDAVPAAARQLHSLDPKRFKTFENLGVAVIDAQTETQIAPLGVYFRSLGKKVFCFSDKQEPSALAAIKDAVDKAYESPEKGFESLILEQTAECALKRYALELVEEERWPSHLADLTPDTDTSLPDLKIALKKFLKKSKGESEAAILLSQCSIEEMPEFLISMIEDIQVCCSNPTIPKPTEAQTVSIESQEDTQESSGSEAAALQEDK